MVNHEIKDINKLLKTSEKVNEKELTYFFDLTQKYPSSKFLFLYTYKSSSSAEKDGL